MFPSPCGDYGSYHDNPERNQRIETKSFRPLAGIMVLIHDKFTYIGMTADIFRPLAGIMVLIVCL